MKIPYIIQCIGLAGVSALVVSTARADSIDLTDGSHLVGKITKIDHGTVFIKTSYAGEIKVDQKEVTGLSTDNPIDVRLASGTQMEGKVSTSGGAVSVVGGDATITTSVAKVAASWPAGELDPEVVAAQRKWAFEAGVDVNGKKGNSSQLGTSGSFRAKYAGPVDTLQFYTAYNRQESNGVKSADQFKAGVDYSDNFSDRFSWYSRDEGGFDRVMDIDFYNIAGAGFGYDFIKAKTETLTGRAGLSYRFDSYSGSTASLKSAGTDFGIENTTLFADSKMVNAFSLVPAFKQFSTYVFTHDSYYELPMANPRWKLRLGLANTYDSKPVVGLKKLDTTYYTRLLLDWQ